MGCGVALLTAGFNGFETIRSDLILSIGIGSPLASPQVGATLPPAAADFISRGQRPRDAVQLGLNLVLPAGRIAG